VETLAELNGGRVFAPSGERLGDFVVSDYLRARRGARERGPDRRGGRPPAAER
jgi:hypothetical protein